MFTATHIDRLDNVFEAFNKPDVPGCAVAVVMDGKVIHAAGYGSSQLEHRIPIAASTVFHVASVSKQFTCFAILLLAERGLLTIDDNIRKHIPELNEFAHTITIRHLIHHTSGLRDQWTLLNIAGWRQDDVITKEHILKLLYRQEDLNFLPGEEHLYCNSGYSLLAEIVERITGKSFRNFLQAEVFDLLGMSSTHVHDDHQEIVPNRTYSYTPKDDGGYQNSVLSFSNHGATSLFTTVKDLAIWMKNFETRQVGSAILVQMIERGRLNSGEHINYVFGLTVSQYRGVQQIQHSGSDAGFRSHILMIPDEKFSVAVLGNVSNSNPAGLAHKIADIVLGDQLEAVKSEETSEPEPPGKPDREEVILSEDCYGEYESRELQTRYQILNVDGQVHARHARHPDVILRCENQDRLIGEESYFQDVQFKRNKDGLVTGFHLNSGRVRNLRFDKVN